MFSLTIIEYPSHYRCIAISTLEPIESNRSTIFFEKCRFMSDLLSIIKFGAIE
jgi:hypothetical protein